MNLQEITAQTQALIAKAQTEMGKEAGIIGPGLSKAITATEALGGINLKGPANLIVPILSPFNASIPRVDNAGDDSARWKEITKVIQPKMSVGEEVASAFLQLTTNPRVEAMQEQGLAGKVTRKAVAMGQNFDDAKARETALVLESFLRGEEITLLGGNITALPAPGSIAIVERDGLGSLAADEYFVNVQALTLHGARREKIDRPDDYDGTDAFFDPVAGRHTTIRPIADGWGVNGTETSVTTVGGGDAIKVTFDPVPGAAAYAVFIGLATGDAALKCEAIITQTSITLKTLAADGATADTVAADTSADALAMDGIIPQLVASGSGAYVQSVNGLLTGANTEVTQIQDMLMGIWDNSNIGDVRILVSGHDSRIITRLGISQNSVRVIVATGEAAQSAMTQGFHVGEIINSATGEKVPVEVQPNLPGGTVVAIPRSIPWAAPGEDLNAAFDLAVGYGPERWDYASTLSTGPIFPFEIREMAVLRSKLPSGCGVLYNIFKG